MNTVRAIKNGSPSRRGVVGPWVLMLCLAGFAHAQRAPNVEELYQRDCASCHDAGGLGGSLFDGEWKNGDSDEVIYANIAKGIPDKEMPDYGDALSEEQIRALVVFLREKENEAAYQTMDLPKPDAAKVIHTQYESYRVETLVEGLATPWSLAFLPDGRKLINERLGPVLVVQPDGTLDPKPIAGTPPVIFDGPEGGMMDIALHPDYAENGWIYLTFADGWRTANDGSRSMTAVVRGRIRDHRWVDQEWIYKADPEFYTRSGAHYGSRIVFDQGYIYIAIGERGAMGQAQDLHRPNGKILRLFDDGRVPEDNPFADDPEVAKGIWSYGHRNAQGLVVDPRTHALYSTEHGARGGDEFNLIEKGKNYGWPVITHGIDYNGQPITALTEKPGMEQPLVQWTPSIAPCGLDYYDGKAFPHWQGDFFAGSLRAQELRRLRVKDGEVVEQELVLKGLGRIRDVRTGPDGYIYLLTDAPARLIRLVPAELPEAMPEQLGVSTAELEKVDAFMERQVENQQIAGGLVMISYQGKIVFFHTYGKRDLEADLPMQKDTIFRIYSMTKAITTAAALKLYEEGKIGLDDPVSKYIPCFTNLQVATADELRPPSRPVTVKDLMLHISGITYDDASGAIGKAWETQKPWEAHDLSGFVERLSKVPLAFDPGTDWHYGASIDVLGRVVEVASGQPLDSYLKETFFDPLDMPDTGFYVPTNKLDRFAAVYEPVEGGGLKRKEDAPPDEFMRPPTLFCGGHGLVSTARDYMRFLSMIARGGELDGNRILKPETVALMTSNQLPESAFPIHFGDNEEFGRGFGHGFAVRTEAREDTIGRVGECGWGGLASTHYWLHPQSNLIVVTMEQFMPYRPDTEDGIKMFIYDAIGSGE